MMTSSSAANRSRQWLPRPWEIRYLLFVGNADMQRLHYKNAKIRNARAGPDAAIYLDSGELFVPQMIYRTTDRDPVSIVFIQFDRSGVVLTENTRRRALIGKRNMLDDVVLHEPESTDLRPYDLAKWSEGIPGDMSFSPAVCVYVDEDRYLENWDKTSLAGNFGCREWTAQMRERDRPYIDVTTYIRGYNFIGEFVGWATFDDPPKPVIGMQGKTWLCLHDCPDGKAPGVIHNFKGWLKKHHYPMPERPPKQPLYPNADYWDDIHEMDND
jgi:hypothetical protein